MSEKNGIDQEFLDRIQSCVDTNDFNGLTEELADKIGNVVQDTVQLTGNAISNGFARSRTEWESRRANFNRPVADVGTKFASERNARGTTRYASERMGGQKQSNTASNRAKAASATPNRASAPKQQLPEVSGTLKQLPGRVSSVVQMALGGAGLGISGGLTLGGILGFGLTYGLTSAGVIASGVVGGLCMLGSAILLGSGILSRKRIQRIREYVKYWRGSSFVMIDQIEKKLGYSRKNIEKDLDYIIDQQLLTYGRLDDNKTCLMLTQEASDQYDAAMKTQKELEEEKRKEEELMNSGTPEQKEWLRTKKQTDEARKQMEYYKNHIKDNDMQERIGTLMEGFDLIVDCIRVHPSEKRYLKRLMDYYVPSTLKLLSVYEDLEAHRVIGDNIHKTKGEIEGSLDMINTALLNMYDDMFANTAMDVTADVKVMETMLTRDGLK